MIKSNPSFYVESQGAFATRFAAEMEPRLGIACPVTLLSRASSESRWCGLRPTGSMVRHLAGMKPRPGMRKPSFHGPCLSLRRLVADKSFTDVCQWQRLLYSSYELPELL